MSFRGAVKCSVCKRFCSKSNKVCPGCNKHCHDKCRQSLCCNPCNSCWSRVLQHRSCVCGKSLRSLGVFVERSRVNPPLTPSTVGNVMTTPLPAKRNANGCSRSVSTLVNTTSDGSSSPVRRGLDFHNENEHPPPGQHGVTTTINLHSHESSRDYLLRVRERGGNGSRDQWEDCRVIHKFRRKTTNRGQEQVMCNIECRLRRDLGETSAWRPEEPIRCMNKNTHLYTYTRIHTHTHGFMHIEV